MNNFCDLSDFELICFLMTRVKKEKTVGFTFSVYALHTLEKNKSSNFNLLNKNLLDVK